MHPSLSEAIFLTIIGLTAGTLDAIAGGGGIITVPALFSIPSLAPFPHLVLGTNKGQSVFGAVASLLRYWRGGLVDRSRAPTAFLLGFTGSILGTLLALAIPPDRLKPVVVTIVAGVAFYLTFRKPAPKHVAMKPRPVLAAMVAFAVGGYDGFIGPGTGTFLIIAFVALLGDGMAQASANAKVANLASNLAAFGLFAFNGKIVWAYALPMAGAQIAGGWIGAHLAVKTGDKLVRRAVLVVSLALIAKVIVDAIKLNAPVGELGEFGLGSTRFHPARPFWYVARPMRRLTNDHGQSTVVNIIIVLVVAALGYLCWVFGTGFIDYWGMKKAVRVACNVAYANRSADAVRDSVMKAWKEADIHENVMQDDGAIENRKIPFSDVQNISVELKTEPPEVTVGLHYTQHFILPWINKEKEIDWDYEHTEDLKQIRW